MLTLSGRASSINNLTPSARRTLLRLATGDADGGSRHTAGLLGQGPLPQGYGSYVALEQHERLLDQLPSGVGKVVLPESFGYLADGDILAINIESGQLRTIYRRTSKHNSFLVTERCNSYCLMCSQPPRDINDEWIADEILEALPLVDKQTHELGFTGGEPTLLGQRFVHILRQCKDVLPSTAIHVLSNGRNFANKDVARSWASVQHPDLMVGIPLYSDVSDRHDYVVQADGAYDETIRGILNLKRERQRVEVRVVLHKQTYARLPKLAEFLARNLLFVDHVALMGLEIMGFTRANLDNLWIDPVEYQPQLREAVQILHAARMNVSIYNLQLCLLDRQLWPFAVQSISDWKNEYIDECKKCAVRERCGGFFVSAQYKRSENIRALAH